MKFNCRIPPQKNLVSTYNQFQMKTASLDLFLQSYQWCRFDPRFGEILIHFINENWRNLNPLVLSTEIANDQWPQVFGVLCSHVSLIINKKYRKAFSAWVDCCLCEVANLNKDWSTFFIGIYSFGGNLQKKEVFEGIKLYSKWGYWGKTPMIEISKASVNLKPTILSAKIRRQKLAELFSIKKRIRVSDYRSYLEFQVSIRIAQLDLKKWARQLGKTRDATYTRKAS